MGLISEGGALVLEVTSVVGGGGGCLTPRPQIPEVVWVSMCLSAK